MLVFFMAMGLSIQCTYRCLSFIYLFFCYLKLDVTIEQMKEIKIVGTLQWLMNGCKQKNEPNTITHNENSVGYTKLSSDKKTKKHKSG